MEIALFWLGFSLLVGLFARRRGRSLSGWIFISILISPLFAILLVAVLQDLKLQREFERVQKCPQCAETIKLDAKICRYCRDEFPSQTRHSTINRPDTTATKLPTTEIDTEGADRVIELTQQDLSKANKLLKNQSTSRRTRLRFPFVLAGLSILVLVSIVLWTLRDQKPRIAKIELDRNFEELDVTNLGTREKSEPSTTKRPSSLSRSQTLVRNIQQGLTDLGYNTGPIDGISGPRTKAAIEAFQRDNGFIVGGAPNRIILENVKDALAERKAEMSQNGNHGTETSKGDSTRLGITYRNSDPSSACRYLTTLGMNSRGYKISYDDEYYCSTPYKDIGTGFPLPNNIAYYVEGDRAAARQLKLVLNINIRQQAKEAHEVLVVTARTLTQKALNLQLPTEIDHALINGRNGKWQISQAQIEVVRLDWPSGIGYEVKFLIQ